MTLPLFLLLLADVVLAAAGQLLLKQGMLIMGPLDFSLRNIPTLFFSVLKNWYVPVAIILYIVGMVLWLFILSKVKLSIAYPSLSVIYIFVISGSWFFFKEAISVTHTIGISLILIGLIFLFYTK